MTDEHGADSQPANEEIPEQDHQAQTQDAGVWSDDHPPVDDFSDAGAASEEATASHEAAATEGEETTVPPQSSRSMLPLFAGIGGILLLGAVIYWQFGHSPSPPPMTLQQNAAPKTSLAANSKSAMPSVSSSKKADETDIDSLYKSAPDQSPPGSMAAAPTTAMAPAPEAATISPSPPTEPAMPPVPAMPATAPALPAQSANIPIPVAPPAPPAVAPAPDQQRIDAISQRMDALQKSIEATTQQLSQLSNMVAANQAMPPVNNQITPALENRLNKIEQNMMQIEHNEAAKPPPVTMPAETEEATPEASSKIVTKPAARHAARPKHASKKKIPASHHELATARMPMESPSSSQWVLRAATPTEAWVATDARTPELRHVQVGDTLPGAGEIRTIRQTPNGWEIQGSTAVIR